MFILRFPFEIHEGCQINDPNGIIDRDDLQTELCMEGRHYVFKISGFRTKKEAESYMANIRVGMAWLLLHKSISSSNVYELQKVVEHKNPILAAENLNRSVGHELKSRVDASIDGARPAVYLAEAEVLKMTGNPVTLTMGVNARDTLDLFSEGASFSRPEHFTEDRKLITALELYSAYFTESSSRAKFLTLIMALEALTVSEERSKGVLEFLDSMDESLSALMKDHKPESDEFFELKAIQEQITHKKLDSISDQIRKVVKHSLSGDDEVIEIVKRTIKLYGIRSRLIHNGRIPDQGFDQAISDARDIVHRVLTSRLAVYK